MAPITVDVRQLSDAYGKNIRLLSSRLFTFEFKDGIDMDQLPLDLGVGNFWIITKGDLYRTWRDTRREFVGDSEDVMYCALGLNFYHTLDPFLSMEKIVENRLITWEVGFSPIFLVISTLDLLDALCDHRRWSIRKYLSHSAWLIRHRLHRLVTGSKEYQFAGMNYNYTPDFSKYINSSTEDTGHTSAPASPHFTLATSSESSSAVLESPGESLLSITSLVDAEEPDSDGDVYVTTDIF